MFASYTHARARAYVDIALTKSYTIYTHILEDMKHIDNGYSSVIIMTFTSYLYLSLHAVQP